jgi:outer membrane lipoprotein-sorting protein
MKKLQIIILSTVLMTLSAAVLQAQSAADILDRMISEYSNSISGIETMMVVTTMEGLIETDEPDTTYYRKATMEDGTVTMQEVSSGTDSPSADYYNFKRNYDIIVENATYEGTETIDGRSAHVLFIEDVSAFYGDMMGGTQPEEGEAQSGRLYIDSSDYVLLRMSFDLQFDEEYTGSVDINMKDYREVDGMKMPFLTEMRIEGISEQFSAEDLAEARQGLRELEQQMDNASGMQRRIMERTIRPQIERFERMLEEDGMSMRVVTQSVETNVTIPD